MGHLSVSRKYFVGHLQKDQDTATPRRRHQGWNDGDSISAPTESFGIVVSDNRSVGTRQSKVVHQGSGFGRRNARYVHKPNYHKLVSMASVSHTLCIFWLGWILLQFYSSAVYDVKPYVHWDIPNEVKIQENRLGGGIGLKLPPWVENKEDVLPSVAFEPEAEETLRYMIRHNKLSPGLYPSKDSMSFVAAKQTLIEILSQDPRSSHRGLSKNQRGSISAVSPSSQSSQYSTSSSYDVYKLSFGRAVIEFVVTSKGAVVKNVVDGSLLSPTSVGDISMDDTLTVATATR